MKKLNKIKELNKKTVVILFRYDYPMIGLRDIMQRITELNKEYNLIIITNNKKIFLGKKNCKIFVIRDTYLFNNSSFVLQARFILLFHTYHIIFFTGIQYLPLASLFIRKPIICYGNVNPQQICGIQNKKRIFQIEHHKLGYLKRLLRLKYLYLNLRKCNKIMAISLPLKKDFIKNGVKEKNVDLIYMGVDTVIFKRKIERKKKHFTIIYPGTISKERGSDTILNGLAIFSKKAKDFECIFIGCRKETKRSIEKRSRELNIKKNIFCLPILDIHKTAEYIRNSDVGISILENNDYFMTSPPTKIFEYMACGIPTIANDIITHNSYIKNGESGLIIENTPESLADALLKTYQNSELRRRLGYNAYIESKKYIWNSQKKKFMDVFQNALKD
jgi:glycosyltransferase involved in cell wall biosynthesis